MTAAELFTPGTEIVVSLRDTGHLLATVVRWKTEGLVAETEDGYHFIPFTSITSVNMDKTPATETKELELTHA